MWVIQLNTADWVCSKTPILLVTWKTQKSTSGESLCIFGSRTIVPISWMCKKQTSVSHSSTESDIILLDAGLRKDGLFALDLCDVVIEVLHSSNNRKSSTQEAAGNSLHMLDKGGAGNRLHMPNTKLKKTCDQNVDQLSNLDHVATNASTSQCETQLCTCEDNEAVIKMIIKRRSPMVRHVSRIHRVALDRSFDRINWDPKIQTKYVDTKNQLAEMLTQGSFTRDEWDHLLRLLNITNFSMFSCSRFLSNRKQSIMSKRAQESKTEEGLAVAKPRP